MKILAIRGKNLASLAGEFVLDFQTAPLANSGLFAITGPTGAGKSTLLDALCLALYDETPRLSKAKGRGIAVPDVGSKSLNPSDSRNLLRRGCAEGQASVDFIGNDGLSYRALWSVKRANGKTNGSLGASKMALFALPDERPVGGSTNKEIKQEIVQRIGLSFEQFTRAVLLAQNEFFAFLKADDNERGELLETLTGSSVYSEISMRAHERERAEKQALELLQQRLAGQQPLSEEERTQLLHAQVQQQQVLQVLEQQRKQIDLALLWHQQFEQFQRAEDEARALVAEAEQQQAALAEQERYFEQVEQVQAARPLLLECERVGSELAKQKQQIASGETLLEKAKAAKVQADQALQRASTSAHVASQAVTQAAPLLDQAKALDAQIATLAPAHASLSAQRTQAQSEASAAQQKLQTQQQQKTRLELAQQASSKWLAEHAGQTLLAQDWPRWDTLLSQAGSLAQEQGQVENKMAQAAKLLLQLEQNEQQTQQALQAAASRYDAANLARQQAASVLAEIPAQEITEKKQQAELRRDSLHSASTVWHEMQTQQQHQHNLQQQQAQQQAALQEAESLLARLRGDEPSLAARLAQAESALKAAEMACASNVQHLRAQLHEGEACPVCGSVDHPYFDADPRLQAMLQALQGQVQTCRQQQQAQAQSIANALAQANSARQVAASVTQQLAQVAQHLRHIEAQWQQQPIVAEIGFEVYAAQYGFWLEQQSQALSAQLLQLHQQEQAWHSAREAQEKAQAAFDDCAFHLTQQQSAASQIAQRLVQLKTEHQANSERAKVLATQLANVLQQLQAAFDGDWQQIWLQDHAAFHTQARAQAQAWLQAQQAHEHGAQALARCLQELEAASTAHAKAEHSAQQQETAFASSLEQINARQEQRAQLFGGIAVKQVETDLQQTLALAQQDLSAQQEASQQAEVQLQTQRSQLASAQQQVLDLIEELEQSGNRMQRWIEQYNQERPEDLFNSQVNPLDDAQLRKLLLHDAQWVQDERRQLQAVAQQVANAHTVLRERGKQIKLHLAQAVSVDVQGLAIPSETEIGVDKPLSKVQLQLAMQQVAANSEAARNRVSMAQQALARDDERQQQTASLQGEIATQQAQHQMWAQLSELIGSADGKKFRNVAQQFTLDALLGYANLHLQQLARRYRLQRIKDTLALLVLDLDMGEEMRSVHSLSGGESFLVSLALALGLASLSSKRVKVESLFIDEGFGSLDADTLRVALDALDGLQALGRKVGVITHVQEMTERIACKVEVKRVSGGKSVVSVL